MPPAPAPRPAAAALPPPGPGGGRSARAPGHHYGDRHGQGHGRDPRPSPNMPHTAMTAGRTPALLGNNEFRPISTVTRPSRRWPERRNREPPSLPPPATTRGSRPVAQRGAPRRKYRPASPAPPGLLRQDRLRSTANPGGRRLTRRECGPHGSDQRVPCGVWMTRAAEARQPGSAVAGPVEGAGRQVGDSPPAGP